MNERTLELALLAGLKKAHGADREYIGDFDWRHFAELIVKECAELFVDQRYMILSPHEPFANERVRALKEHDKDTVKKIKEHFGVKE
jgi:hypothetical protein